MSKFKVVVTDHEYESMEIERQEMSKIDVDFYDSYQCKTEDEVIDATKDADGVIVQYAKITPRVIDHLKKCKVISTYSIGVDKIDIKSATAKNICVANVPDYCVDEVSDHAVLLMLAIARKLTLLNGKVKSGVWDYKVSKPIYRIKGKKLGLIGFGKIPKLVAKKAQSFGMKVYAYDPYITAEEMSKYDVSRMEFDDIIQTVDFVSIHVPLLPSTKEMFNEAAFKKMKKTSYLINAARGPVVDEKALIEALQNKEIAGAALDVVYKEPISKDNLLVKMDNVIITPHVAWYSEESAEALQRTTAQQVVQELEGYYPKNLVNRELKGKLNLKER